MHISLTEHPNAFSRQEFSEQILKTIVKPYFKENPALAKLIMVDGLAAVGKGTFCEFLIDLGYIALAAGEYIRTACWWYTAQRTERVDDEDFYSSIKMLQVNYRLDGGERKIQVSHPSFNEPTELDPKGIDETSGLRSGLINNLLLNKLSTDRQIVEWYHNNLFRLVSETDSRVVLDGRNNYELVDDPDINQHWPEEIANAVLIYLYATRGVISQRTIKRVRERKQEAGNKATFKDLYAALATTHARNDSDMSKSTEKLLTPGEAIESKKYSAVVDTSNLSPEEVAVVSMLVIIRNSAEQDKPKWEKLLTTAIRKFSATIHDQADSSPTMHNNNNSAHSELH